MADEVLPGHVGYSPDFKATTEAERAFQRTAIPLSTPICPECQHFEETSHAHGCSRGPLAVRIKELEARVDTLEKRLVDTQGAFLAYSNKTTSAFERLVARVRKLEEDSHPPISQMRIEARLTAVEDRLSRALERLEFAGQAVSATPGGCDELKKT